MDFKQKLGYIILGAVIMLVGIWVGSLVSPPLIAQGDGVFGEIKCAGLTVVDEHGKTMIRLEADLFKNAVVVYNKVGEEAIRLIADINSNNICVYNQVGEPAIYLDANVTGNFVEVYDPAEDKTAITLASAKYTNHVWVHSKRRIYNQSPEGSVYEAGAER